MADILLEDHLVGIELQVVELVEQRERAEVQGRTEDVARIQREIDALYAEMARTTEQITAEHHEPAHIHAAPAGS
jgi:hypothetical protein